MKTFQESFRDFSVELKINETQIASTGGINVELSLEYVGTENIEIHNPIYFLQFNLTETNKGQIFTGVKPPILLVNRIAAINEKTDLNFTIQKIKKNDQNLNIRDEVNNPIIHLHKGDRQSYNLQISKFLNPQTKELEDIPEGECVLESICSIVAANTTDDKSISHTFRFPKTTISFLLSIS